jgi:Ankyrin repeats (many copies)
MIKKALIIILLLIVTPTSINGMDQDVSKESDYLTLLPIPNELLLHVLTQLMVDNNLSDGARNLKCFLLIDKRHGRLLTYNDFIEWVIATLVTCYKQQITQKVIQDALDNMQLGLVLPPIGQTIDSKAQEHARESALANADERAIIKGALTLNSGTAAQILRVYCLRKPQFQTLAEDHLAYAIKSNLLQDLLFLLKGIVNPNIKLPCHAYLPSRIVQKPALMVAIDFGQEEAAMILIVAGADVNAQDAELRSPLIQATYSSASISLVQALIKAGADITAKDRSGNTALSYALGTENTNKVKLAKTIIDTNNYVNNIKKQGSVTKNPLH